MSLLSIPLAQVGEQHLQSLITDEVREGRHIDYKRETYGGNDDARAEFLADISSFANSDGGDLILGMAGENGLPVALPGLDASLNLDAETLRLEQMARAGLQPRIPALAFHEVPLASGGRALVIRIARSYAPPHRVIFKGRNRFWARSSAGKFEPDVGELRLLFNVVPQLAERIRDFRAARISHLMAGETPLPLRALPGTIAVHVVPFTAVDASGEGINLEAAMNRLESWLPWGNGGCDYQVNFDGFVTIASRDEHGATRAYTQVFRTGAVEIVATDQITEDEADRLVFLEDLEQRLITSVHRAATGFRRLGVSAPIAVSVTMLGMRGALFVRQRPRFMMERPTPAVRDVLTFTDIVVPDGVDGLAEVAAALRPICDQMNQTGGQLRSPIYDSDGNLRVR